MTKESPYKPSYKGFDEAETERAQATADHAREHSAARGEDANKEYVDEGPHEAAERTGRTEADLGRAIERAAKRRK